VWAALAQQAADLETLVQLHQRRSQVQAAVGLGADVVHLRACSLHFPSGPREDRHVRFRLGQQPHLITELKALGDDAGERLSSHPRPKTQIPTVRLWDQPAVALVAHGAGAGKHRVHSASQAVKQRPVSGIAESAGAPVERRATVCAADHVEHHVRAAVGRHRPLVQPQCGHHLRDRAPLGRGQQPTEGNRGVLLGSALGHANVGHGTTLATLAPASALCA